MSHILVVANETAASEHLLDAVRGEAHAGVDLVTVLAPVSPPSPARSRTRSSRFLPPIVSFAKTRTFPTD